MKVGIVLALAMFASIALGQDDTTEPIRARILALGKTNLPISWVTNMRSGTIACAVKCEDEKEADVLWKDFKSIESKVRLTQRANTVIVVVSTPDGEAAWAQARLAAQENNRSLVASPFSQVPQRPRATSGLDRTELLKQAGIKRDLAQKDFEDAARLDREASRLDGRVGWHTDGIVGGYGLEGSADRLQNASDAIQTTPYSKEWFKVPNLEGGAFVKRNEADRLADDAMRLSEQADGKRADAARLQREAMDLERQADQSQR